MILIGLTGGISCGKSSVSRILHDRHGVVIIDCDEIVRELQQPGTACVIHIQRTWPQCVDADSLALRREVLSDLVFRDPAARRKLASIMNRRVFLAIFRKILAVWWRSSRDDVVILDAPLLFETNIFTKFVSASLVVACSEDLQLSRLVARNQLSSEGALQRIRSQMPMSEKIRRADFVVQNESSSFEMLQRDVTEAFGWMKQQSRHRLSAMIAAVAGGALCLAVAAASAAAKFAFPS